MKVKIHREGTNILIVVMLIMIVINLSAWMFIRPAVIPIVFSSISAILYLLIVNFFRSPRRTFRGDRENVVVSSVDGTVVALEEVFEPEVLRRKVRMVSVFMTVFNVHAYSLSVCQSSGLFLRRAITLTPPVVLSPILTNTSASRGR